MWSMILQISRLPGGHSLSAGRRSEKLGYQQSTVDDDFICQDGDLELNSDCY